MAELSFRETAIRSKKILRSAKGKPCSARLPGICNGDPETTVWAHLNGAAFGKGLARKAHDILGFYSCSSCHAAYDVGHGTKDWLAGDMHKYVLEAVCETWVSLIVDGIVIVPLDAERLSHERPTKPRKPREQRTRVPHNPDRKIQSRNTLRKRPERVE